MKMRGEDLSTNLEFHYGLVCWFLAREVWAKPTTRFVVPYLTAIGLLKREADDLDLDLAFREIGARFSKRFEKEPRRDALLSAHVEVLARKETLLLRPLRWLLADPHILSAWLSLNLSRFRVERGRVLFLENPAVILRDTYQLLNMDHAEGWPAAHVIWSHDRALLDRALGFYSRLAERFGRELPWGETRAVLDRAEPPAGFDAESWARVRAADAGFMRGMEVLGLLPLLADRAGFFELRVERDLRVAIPERLLDPKLQAEMKKVLVPPPVSQSNEIAAAMGGMCYLREAPHLPPIVAEGQHFVAGQALYIIEVMKMFNKVTATFSGTVKRVLVGDGVVVRKGQVLFEVEPDEPPVVEDDAARAARRKARTRELVDAVM
jgi:biotin carboxyl carrier protein